MKLEFLICGSLNEAFLSQIAFFRLSLDALNGYYRKARVVAVFGDHQEEIIPTRWRPHFENIDVVWAHRPGDYNPSHRAQHYKRFENMSSDADLAIMCDADTIVMAPFPELVTLSIESPSVFGVLGHTSPIWKKKGMEASVSDARYWKAVIKKKIELQYPWLIQWLRRQKLKRMDRQMLLPKLEKGGFTPIDWKEIAQIAIKKDVELKYDYVFTESRAEPKIPFYINYGFVAGSPAMLRDLYRREKWIVNKIEYLVGGNWAHQIGLALAIEDLGAPRHSLPLRYNYPNFKVADQLFPDELDNIIVLHYQRSSQFEKSTIFLNKKNFEKFLRKNLTGSNKLFQEHVKKMTGGGEYPF